MTAITGLCPNQPEQHDATTSLVPSDMLLLPMQRSVVQQYALNPEGVRELRLFYGDKEISFDDPAFFGFGEALAKQSRFAAGDATGWGGGYAWHEVEPLLAQLVDDGILRRAGEADADERVARSGGERASPLPPATCERARDWTACDPLMRELTGRPLEAGHLELVVPVFRVAHPALDADGRQVGEANVFPPALRIDVPTRWRTCIYAGTRFQTERPMNVTALKAMRTHWPAMMALLRAVRAAYLRRFPDAAAAWTVGHLERLSTSVLALPTYLLMREHGRIGNGELHPALSCLFRVTDGLRMTMHQMLFVPVGEPTLDPDAPMTSADILAYAERNYSFHSEHGVCAGPQAMIAEFLSVVVDGNGAEAQQAALDALDPALKDALSAVEPALDYGLLGLQAYATVFSLWPAMSRAYARIAELLDLWPAPTPAPIASLRERLHAHLRTLRTASYLGKEQWRAEREHVYADMFDRCAAGLEGRAGGRGRAFADWVAGYPHRPTTRALRDPLRAAVLASIGMPPHAELPAVDALTTALLDYAQRERALLALACDVQARINALLGRRTPLGAFSAADIDLHNRLQGPQQSRLPHLFDVLADTLAIRLVIDDRHMALAPSPRDTDGRADACVEPIDARARSVRAPSPNSAGMVPAEPRANRTTQGETT
ncbi:MAG: hypothetical protein AB7P21_22950 [Lautropia sp.]